MVDDELLKSLEMDFKQSVEPCVVFRSNHSSRIRFFKNNVVIIIIFHFNL